ncbi:DUF1254 domain-containing protein [Sphingosinicella sp.]|uniref:DUF1254 domain-containing protein n=1 Tax=Sphingosinicella sp. TaxID=1917971 RepID=UPI0018059AC5|nr:DUF1254 domain-containing protein [Sphingosinicella sp.]MBA4757895.1 DUF1254 domain-containing protein [Sphingosinicella sp.]
MRWLGPILLAALVAALAYVAALWATPHVIMAKAMETLGAGSVNVMRHQGLPNAESRFVVRPSPDLAYSICVFDLAKGPVAIDAFVPPQRYWSLSVFDANTDNIFSVNDRTATGRYALTLSKDGTGGSLAVPGGKGIALIRILVTDAEDLAAIDTLRRRSTCAPA